MKTLLIVDDDPMLLEMYQMKFSRAGFNVTTLSEPEKFMQEIKEKSPNLVLLDRRLGNADGLELLKALRQIPENKTLPVFILSNMDPSAEEFAAVKAMAPAEYLIKEHVDLNQLVEKIKTALA